MLVLYIEPKEEYLQTDFYMILGQNEWFYKGEYPERNKTPSEIYDYFMRELSPLVNEKETYLIVTVSEEMVNGIGVLIERGVIEPNVSLYLANIDRWCGYDNMGCLIDFPYGYFRQSPLWSGDKVLDHMDENRYSGDINMTE